MVFFKMQTINLRISLKLAAVNKNFVRCVAVSPSPNDTIGSTRNLKSWRKIPGPLSLPIIGSLLNFLPGGSLNGCTGVFLSEKIHKLYGPIAKIDGVLGMKDTIWIFDADAVEYILRSENTMPIRPGFDSLDYYRQRHNKTYDPRRVTGLISDQGETWKEFRAKVNHILLQPKTIKLYSSVLEDVADDMIKRMKSIRDENNMIKDKFDIEMNLWALESISVVALGTRLNCFDPNLPEDSAARKLIQNVHDFFDIAEKLDFRPNLWRIYSTSDFKKGMKIYESQESLTKVFIARALKNYEESKKSGKVTSDSEKPVLEKLLEIDPNVALIMASDMLLAGVDTAANTATATFYLLAKNPDKQNKLREEVLANRDRRPYLKACLKESMRMMPAVQGNARMTTKEHELMGYKIPKDILIVLSHQYMSIMEQYHPKPFEFIPERWLGEKDDPLYYGKANPFVTAPFGFGVRMCIGRRIAQLEMETFISKVVENFQVEWNGPPPNIKPAALNYVTGPFNFIFKDV